MTKKENVAGRCIETPWGLVVTPDVLDEKLKKLIQVIESMGKKIETLEDSLPSSKNEIPIEIIDHVKGLQVKIKELAPCSKKISNLESLSIATQTNFNSFENKLNELNKQIEILAKTDEKNQDFEIQEANYDALTERINAVEETTISVLNQIENIEKKIISVSKVTKEDKKPNTDETSAEVANALKGLITQFSNMKKSYEEDSKVINEIAKRVSEGDKARDEITEEIKKISNNVIKMEGRIDESEKKIEDFKDRINKAVMLIESLKKTA